MIGGNTNGWLTALADMSLILFMVAAASAQDAPPPPPPVEGGSPTSAAALEEPVAIYRPGTGLSLTQWLAQQAPDARLQLTVRASYKEGAQQSAADRAFAMASEAEKAGVTPRLVIEASTGNDLAAILAYDRNNSELAQPLRE